jgi:anti-sigma B factor antagonist
MADHATDPITFDFALTEERLPNGAHVVAVSGEVDIFTAPDLKRTIAQAIEGGTRLLVIDLTQTRFLDSTALGVLIGAVKRLRPLDGRLAIVNTEPSTAKTFQITGLDRIFTIVETREAAVEAVSG